jgi:cytochrome c oxidase assembly protein subunit 15
MAGPDPAALPNPPRRHSGLLQALAVTLLVLLIVLIAVGGSVTSLNAGLAVPDWPTTFGHNMFTAPLDVWLYAHDTLAEHAHRLIGSLVGLVSIAVLVVAVWKVRRRRWLIALAAALLVLISVQGVLGGTRVTETSDLLAFFHGILGQLILAMAVVLAAMTTRHWALADADAELHAPPSLSPAGRRVRTSVVLLLGVIVVQLVLGAGVRHSHAALAVPDFPLHYGQVVPPITQDQIDAAVQRAQTWGGSGQTYPAWQVWLHLSHRAGAAVVTLVLLVTAWLAWRWSGHARWPVVALLVLLVVQLKLGMVTIWTGEHPGAATAHQTVGALLLASATWLAVRAHHASRIAAAADTVSLPSLEGRGRGRVTAGNAAGLERAGGEDPKPSPQPSPWQGEGVRA